jgi:hypothetical protein
VNTHLFNLGYNSRTSYFVTELDHVEALAADGTAVGPFDPGFETVIVEVVAAREEVSNLLYLCGRFVYW